MKIHIFLVLVALLAVAAIILGFMALQEARYAQQLAMSDIIVEEVNSISTPVFDQESGQYSYLALYDISIANMSGPQVVLKSIKKSTSGAGFLTLLKGQDIVSHDVNESAFVSTKGSGEIKSNPRLLKTVGQQDMGEGSDVNLILQPGENKVVHIGLTFNPYDAERQALASVALVSYELLFDNGKSYIFQRAVPIFPIPQ